LKEERASYWLKSGAQPTDIVRQLLIKAGLIDRKLRVKEEKVVKGSESLGA
jgi:ribosomal protein S16